MSKPNHRRGNQALLMALACGATVEVAARSAGLSVATVYRRLKDPGFRKELRQVSSGMAQRIAGMLTAAGGEAAKTLLALLKETTPAAVRLGTARAVLELGMKAREVTDLEERLAALEERSPSNKPRRR